MRAGHAAPAPPAMIQVIAHDRAVLMPETLRQVGIVGHRPHRLAEPRAGQEEVQRAATAITVNEDQQQLRLGEHDRPRAADRSSCRARRSILALVPSKKLAGAEPKTAGSAPWIISVTPIEAISDDHRLGAAALRSGA